MELLDELRALARREPPGSRLPSVRQLMRRHRVGPATVERALSRLTEEGLVRTQPGSGTFVAPRRSARRRSDLGWQEVSLALRSRGEDVIVGLLSASREGTIPLNAGYPEEALQPIRQLGAAMARAARHPAAWGRAPAEGVLDLRTWFARDADSRIKPHEVVIAHGGQSALSIAFRALTAPGDPLLVESPTYLGALAAARQAGLQPVPVPTDRDGVRPDHLEEALKRTRARLFYCQPTFANPHGAVLSAERRSTVLSVVERAQAFLIEDDWARDLVLEGSALRPLVRDDDDGHVVYVRSLTKSAAPSLRVAAICARGPAGARLREAHAAENLFLSAAIQLATTELLSSPAWTRHLRSLRQSLRLRRDALAEALQAELGSSVELTVPDGGLHLWLRLPDGCDDLAVTSTAQLHDVAVMAGRQWFPAEPPAAYLRVSFGGCEPDTLREGARRLSRSIAEVAAHPGATPTPVGAAR